MPKKRILPEKLEDLPNIGPSIANDLRKQGYKTPQDLAKFDPLKTYLKLAKPMGPRHDPCVFYTFLATEHFLKRENQFHGGNSPLEAKKSWVIKHRT